jgi:hypothetical protein
VAPDEAGARAAPDQPEPRPQVGGDLQAVAVALVEGDHPLLADRVHGLELRLGLGDRVGLHVVEEPPGLRPGLLLGVTGDQLEPDPEAELASVLLGQVAHLLEALGDHVRRLAPPPGQQLACGLPDHTEENNCCRGIVIPGGPGAPG